MAKEKKSVPFSTRWTEAMDSRLDELSDALMLTKHDIVRIAVSEYLVKYRELIDKNIEYKKDKSKTRYNDFDLITITTDNTDESGKWIEGINFDDNDTPVDFVKLVKIEVNVPLIKDRAKIPTLINQFNSATDEEKRLLEKHLMDLISTQIAEEYTLKYTADGVLIKDDPRFQQYVHKAVSDIIEEIRNPKK